MIGILKLIHSNQDKEDDVSLHPRIVDILFEHRRFVKSIFLQIKGHYEIDYFGINIINPANELLSFSSLPHIEYNMIQQHFWNKDLCFFSKSMLKNTLHWWDEANLDNLFREQINSTKLVSNHFKVGMTIPREIEQFHFLYSYATNSNKKDLKKYYQSQIFGLIDIGDYFCNSILELYSECCNKHRLPQLKQLNSKVSDVGIGSTLKLIVNNS